MDITYNSRYVRGLYTRNVQGIRNKTGEIMNGLEELKQDITILTATKKKGNRVETLRPYVHFYSEVSKEKKSQTRSIYFS
jgi:hypothetical protein